MLTTEWGPVETRGGCGAGWGPCACPDGNVIQWGLRGANRSHPHEDKHKAQYISNRDEWCGLGQQFGALGSHHHDHKILKALPRCKGLGRRDIALLGFVFFVDLLDLSAIDAQVPLGQQVASQALQQALSAPAL